VSVVVPVPGMRLLSVKNSVDFFRTWAIREQLSGVQSMLAKRVVSSAIADLESKSSVVAFGSVVLVALAMVFFFPPNILFSRLIFFALSL